MKKISYCLMAFVTTLIVDSCQPPEPIISSDSETTARGSVGQKYVDYSVVGEYQIRNGLFYFKSAETFVALDTSLRKMNPEDRINFTKKLGFKSLLENQLEAYKELSEAENQGEYSGILASNKDILKVTGVESRVTSIFEEVSACLLNREGMVSIGGRVHCFVKGRTIVAPSVDEVRSSYKAGKKMSEGTSIYDDTKAAGARLGFGPCSSIFQAAQSSDGQRRIEIRVDILRRIIQTETNHCNIDFYLYVRGDPFKKNFFGNWVSYSTGNTLTPRFLAGLKVNNPVFISPAYNTYSQNVNVPSFSNESSFIDWSYTMVSVYGAVYSDTVNGYGYTYETSLDQNNPIGTYTSGGVPNGVQMVCP